MAEERIENIEELEYAGAQSELTTAVVQTKLNVRKTPSLDAEIIRVLSEGSIVKILEDGTEWVKISDGYCMKKFLK